MAICSQMDARLKSHVAEISPVANAFYMAGGDCYRLSRTREAIILMIRAIREGYQVLQELGIPIVPARHKLLQWIPESILVPLAGHLFKRKEMAELIGHADAAREEMKQAAEDFRILARSISVPTPAIDHLYRYRYPDRQPVADGSPQLSVANY